MNLARLLHIDIEIDIESRLIWTCPQERCMRSACRKYCLEAIQLSEALIQLANNGSADCDDDRYLVLFGIILDSAYRILQEAEKNQKV